MARVLSKFFINLGIIYGIMYASFKIGFLRVRIWNNGKVSWND